MVHNFFIKTIFDQFDLGGNKKIYKSFYTFASINLQLRHRLYCK